MQKLLKKYADKISQCAEGERAAIPELWQTTIAKGERRTLDEYVMSTVDIKKKFTFCFCTVIVL